MANAIDPAVEDTRQRDCRARLPDGRIQVFGATAAPPPVLPIGQSVRVQLRRPTVILLSLATLSASCGRSSKVEPLGIGVQGDRDLILYVACADATAEVSETSDEVRVENLSGDVTDGDCLGTVALTLEQPLGTRTLVVEGETWHDVGHDCPWGVDDGDVPHDSCWLP